MNEISQLDLIMEFFKANPNRNVAHPEVVDWVVNEYKKRTNKVFRDPDRGIRSLHQKGILQKIKKGKKMFIQMLESVKNSNEKELIAFLRDVLEVYEKHNINGHIKWKK